MYKSTFAIFRDTLFSLRKKGATCQDQISYYRFHSMKINKLINLYFSLNQKQKNNFIICLCEENLFPPDHDLNPSTTVACPLMSETPSERCWRLC